MKKLWHPFGWFPFFCVFLKPKNTVTMNKASIIVLLALALGFCSCGDQPSKQFKAMEEELRSIETKINEITDCDDLQLMNFGILGLRSDMDNYRLESEMTEAEIEQLDGMIDQLEATWNGKWASLDCEQNMMEDELDTSGEEQGALE